MDTILKQLPKALPVRHEKVDFSEQAPLCKIYRFFAYKLKNLRHNNVYVREQGIDFLITGEKEHEKIIIYCTISRPFELCRIKWVRKPELDEELSELLVKAFISNYLKKQYVLKDDPKLQHRFKFKPS